MWAIRQRFKSPRVILPGENDIYTDACMSKIQIERQVWTFQWKEITENTEGELLLTLTLVLRFDQVEHLAEQILEGQRFDAHSFHPLTLFLIEILQLKHGQDTIAICVHAAEPVLYTRERNSKIEHVTAGWYATHLLDTLREKETVKLLLNRCLLPGGIFLVFFGNEEPDELSVAHPAFSLHSVTAGYKRDSVIHIHYLWWSNQLLCLSMCAFPLTE